MRACHSTDEGQTWDNAFFVTADLMGGILDAGVHTLSEGSIFLHCSTTELTPKNPERATNEWIARGGIPL